MTTPVSFPNASQRRHSRLRKGAWLILASLTFWLFLAYLALPAMWTRIERHNLLAKHDMLTRTRQGFAGDPINVGLVGEESEILCAFRSAGWTLADSVTLRSSLKIAGSVALRRPDPAAPVSPLYFENRVEDVAFQLPVGLSAATRHHIRLWKTGDSPFDHRPLWLASASYDRGVGLSHYTLQVTHRIAPDRDAERAFVGEALAKAGAVRGFFQFAGIGPTLRGKNGGGDPYFTDGEVLVALLQQNCALRPDEKVAPPVNPPHVDLRSAIVHAMGGRQ